MKYLIINALLFSLFFNLSVFNLLGESRERLFYDAIRAEASGDLEKAIEIYSTIAKESHSANLHANLANLYFKMEDYAFHSPSKKSNVDCPRKQKLFNKPISCTG